MIVHVSSVYPPKLGGLEKVVAVLAKTQQQLGDEVLVLTSDQDFSSANTFQDVVPVVRLKSFVFANTTIMFGLLRQLLRRTKEDIIHLHIAQAFVPEMVWLAAKIRGYQYVAHVHLDVPPSGPFGFLLNIYKSLVLKRVLHSAKYVIVFTNDQKSDITAQYGLAEYRVVVIANGVEDVFYFSDKRAPHTPVRLLFVGRFGYQKNLSLLLRALEGISDTFDTTLVGNGEDLTGLQKLAGDLRLKNITFAGRADGQELLDYYKRADIFVLPSEREGMPLVLLEAMAMGLPIVATNVTGSRDVVVNNDNGLLVPFGDVTAFRAALQSLATSPELYMRMSKASARLSKKYSWPKISSEFKSLYESKV